MVDKEVKIIVAITILIILISTVALGISSLPLFDLQNFTTKESTYKHKLSNEYIKIYTENDHYYCMGKCTIPIYVETTFYKQKDFNDSLKRLKFTGNQLDYKIDSEDRKEKGNNLTTIYYVSVDVPTNTADKEFNFSINMGDEEFVLDPLISGCVENATHVICSTNTFTGNAINTTKSILINFSTVDATIAYPGDSFLILNASNSTNPPTITIANSIIHIEGSTGGPGSDSTQTCSSGAETAQGGSGTNGRPSLFQTTAPTYIENTTILAEGGKSGKGGDATMNAGAGAGCPAAGGAAGNTGRGNVTGYFVSIKNSVINASGGALANGGFASNGEAAGNSQGGAGSSGTVGGGYFRNLYGGATYFNNVTIIANGQSGGNAGSCTGGVATAANGGVGQGGFFFQNSTTFNMVRTNISVNSGTPGKGSCGGTNNGLQEGNFYMEALTSIAFRDMNLSILNSNLNATINLTDVTTNKFGIFRTNLFINNSLNFTIHCSASSLTVGNNTVLHQNISFVNCGTISYISENQFDESISVGATLPTNNTFSFLILSANLTVNNSAGNGFTNVSLVINGTTNSTNTSAIPANGNFYLNMSNTPLEGDYLWHITGCSVTGNCVDGEDRYFHFDNSTPNITFVNPPTAGNISIYNLTLNITISSNTLNWTNITVYYPNGTVWFNNYSYPVLSSITFNQTVNFTLEGNYSVNVTATDQTGLQNLSSSWFFFDNSAPSIQVLSPTMSQIFTATTINLTFNLTEKYGNVICYYRIDRNATGFPNEIPQTLISCSSVFNVLTYTTASGLTDAQSYILYINASDGFHDNSTNVNFSINVGGGGSGTPGGGGGGGPDVTRIIIENINYELKTAQGATKASLFAAAGGLRTVNVVISNRGDTLPGITMACVGEQCTWISFQNTTVNVDGGGKVNNKVIITVPDKTIDGIYQFKIKALFQDSERTLELSVNVGLLGNLLKTISIGKFEISVFALTGLTFLALTFILILPLMLLIKEPKTRKYVPAISLVVSFLLSFALGAILVF